jgi:hypothetical protein
LTFAPFLSLPILLAACGLLLPAAVAAAPLAASGEVPISGTSLVGVQEGAIRKAMENAVDSAVRQALPGSAYESGSADIAARILPLAESFVTHYVIEGREISDASYTVRLSLDLDLPLLRKRLAALGLLGGGEGASRWRLAAEGVPAPVLAAALSRLEVALGEDGSVVPVRFAGSLAEYGLSTTRSLAEAASALADPGERPALVVEETPDGLLLRFPVPARELAAFGQTVTFYRRAPGPGEADPGDVRGVETVPWREVEPNDTPAQAELLPFGEGVLGAVDPASDRDFYRVELPPHTAGLVVVAGNTGPGEFRPRVRVFSDGGSLLWEGKAAARGRSLMGSFAVPTGVSAVLLSIEDDLGRVPSRFPYRLTVSARDRGDAP